MMIKHCFTEECGFGATVPTEQGNGTEAVCQALTEQIIAAGGAGLLEVSPCPMVAMGELAPDPSNTPEAAMFKAVLCGRLGIVGFSQDSLD
jgi:hypothetical protein